MNYQKYFMVALTHCCIVMLLHGCFTPSKERQLKGDIFNLQTRMVAVEEYLSKKGGDQEFKVASTQTRMDQLQVEMQRIHGDIDTLRQGVITGKMPGMESSKPPEGSVAKTLEALATRLDSLSTRLDQIDQKQAEMVDSISKRGPAPKGKDDKKENKKEKKGAVNKEIADFKDAYNAKRYKYVVENGQAIVEKAPKKDQSEVIYIYAESLYKLGKLKEAALEYNDYVTKFPSLGKVPHAKMRMGDCFRHLGDTSTAKLYYKDLLENHPNSDEAKKAKERLSEL